jgi:predicted O-methyltransferase YrrM
MQIMGVKTALKQLANRITRKVGFKIDSLTSEKQEIARLAKLRELNYFDHPAFPLPRGIGDFNTDSLTAAFDRFGPELKTLMQGGAEPGRYDPGNEFFKSPDAEILYLMVRSLRPRRIVEVGSGNSTRIIRQAISDARLAVEHVAIDPAPRSDIAGLVNRMLLSRFEHVDAEKVTAQLAPNDILFIDSSHEVKCGNDVARLFCVTLPSLADGVVVHVHDVFLPFDYPEPFNEIGSGWGEQYLLEIFLHAGRHEILWPGYYLQKQRLVTVDHLPFLAAGIAQSFWFKVRWVERDIH